MSEANFSDVDSLAKAKDLCTQGRGLEGRSRSPGMTGSRATIALDLTTRHFAVILRAIMRPTVLLNFGERGVGP
jgi:hypothetical protein